MTLKQFNKILRIPEKIECDKRMHYLLGTVFVFIMMMFTLTYWIIISSLIIFAYAIEFYQKFTNSGHFDHYDALAVIIGGLVVFLPTYFHI